MKQLILCLGLGFCIAVRAFSQAPAWSVEAADWQYTLSLRAEIYLDGAPLNAAAATVAAFAGNELRGVATGQPLANAVYFYLAAFANQYSGEELRFRVYIPSINRVLNAAERLVFQNNAVVGLSGQPFRLNLRSSNDFPPALADFPNYSAIAPAQPDTIALSKFLISVDGDPVSWAATGSASLSAQIVGGDKLVVQRLNSNWTGTSGITVKVVEEGTSARYSATKAVVFTINPAPGAPDLVGSIPPKRCWAWAGNPFQTGDLKTNLGQPAPPCVAYDFRFLPPTGNALAPGWQQPPLGGFSMLFTARALFGGHDFPGNNLVMAAFVGGQLAGIASPVKTGGKNVYLFSLAPVGSGPITLKLYDPLRKKIHERTTNVSYAAQGIAGSPSAPIEAEFSPLLPSISASGIWSVTEINNAWEGELLGRFYARNCASPEKMDSLDAVFYRTTSCVPGDFYRDNDLDGYGTGAPVGFGCTPSAGQSRLLGDCADADPARFPNNLEICDGKDNDCLNGVPYTEADADADGYRICAGDCDDAKPAVNPGKTERCNGLDDDCDGFVDLADPGFLDLAPPTARCKNTNAALANGSAFVLPAMLDDGSSDDCSPSVQISILAGTTTYNCGNIAQSPFTVALKVVDASGNSASCQSQVTVTDASSPQPIGPRTAADGVANDNFGSSAAIQSGVVAVGATGAKVGANIKQGAVYFFYQNTPTANKWGQKKKVWAADGAPSDFFGNAIAIDGDVLLAGAYGDNVGVTSDQGSSYIFQKNLGGTDNWGQAKQLFASDGGAYHYFGAAVALRNNTALVGANKAKVGANTGQGAAYVFQKDLGGAGNWGQQKKMVAADGAANNFFGQSAALADDGASALVGAPGHMSNRGSSYIFQKDLGGAGNWGQEKKLVANDAVSGDLMGSSVATGGNIALVGAPGKNSSAGAAYIFQKDLGGSNNWGQAKKLVPIDAAAGARFGGSVALFDGFAYVGAHAANGKGAVYVFQKDLGGSNNWGQMGKYVANDGAANDQYGFALAVRNGYLAVGANLDDLADKVDAGSIHLFAEGLGCAGSLMPGDDPEAGGRAAVSLPGGEIVLRCAPTVFSKEMNLSIEADRPVRIEVVAASGTPLAQVNVPAGAGELSLNADDWPTGILFVTAFSSDGAVTIRAAKMR